MIKKLIINTEPFLPLKISEITWGQDIFHMSGSMWHFTCLSAWRFCKRNIMNVGCFDERSHEIIETLKNSKIIAIEEQNHLSIDPVFLIENERKIEIFSTDISKPWTFFLEGLGSYYATPSTPHLFDSKSSNEIN